jgi:hypothetical protein
MRTPACIVVGLALVAAAAAVAGSSRVISASASRIDAGGYRIWDRGSRQRGPTYAQAIAAFGARGTCRLDYGKNDGVVRWSSLGVTAEFVTLGVLRPGSDACKSPRDVFLNHLIVASPAWVTLRGLRVGDPASKLLRLYLRARRHGSSYWLITDSNPAVGIRPLFAADTRNGKVSSLIFTVQAEGE